MIIVTADHSHTMTISGYQKRGNPIFGLTSVTAKDRKRYTTLGYMNGPGAKVNSARDWPRYTQSRYYKQQSLVPLGGETHGADDVGEFLLLCMRNENSSLRVTKHGSDKRATCPLIHLHVAEIRNVSVVSIKHLRVSCYKICRALQSFRGG